MALSSPCLPSLQMSAYGGVNAENLKHERGEIYES